MTISNTQFEILTLGGGGDFLDIQYHEVEISSSKSSILGGRSKSSENVTTV